MSISRWLFLSSDVIFIMKQLHSIWHFWLCGLPHDLSHPKVMPDTQYVLKILWRRQKNFSIQFVNKAKKNYWILFLTVSVCMRLVVWGKIPLYNLRCLEIQNAPSSVFLVLGLQECAILPCFQISSISSVINWIALLLLSDAIDVCISHWLYYFYFISKVSQTLLWAYFSTFTSNSTPHGTE